MNPFLFLTLMVILAAALPWWPYSAYGRLRHRRPWDWLRDTPTREDFLTASETSTGCIGQRPKLEAAPKVKLCGDSETQGDDLLNQFRERWTALERDCAA